MANWQGDLLKDCGLMLIGLITGIGRNWLKKSDRKSKLQVKTEERKISQRLKDNSVDIQIKRKAKVTEMLIKHRKHEITPDEFREFGNNILMNKRQKRGRTTKDLQTNNLRDRGSNGGRVEYLPNGDKIEWIHNEGEGQEFSIILLRGEEQLHAAEEELFDKVWWNRHQIWKEKIESGEESKPDLEIWARATAAAKRIEDKYGLENLGWSDFEWGMVNGKLSALRWVLGDEWDFLDT